MLFRLLKLTGARKREIQSMVSEGIAENGATDKDLEFEKASVETRLYYSYISTARANAESTAAFYAAPTSTSLTAGTGYSYFYPSGYSKATLDCTNYVSFCLNYSNGGNIPEDSTGSCKWRKNTHERYNVDGFYEYFSVTKNNKEKGFYGTTYYSESSYPSSTVRANTEVSDIIQFSSVRDSVWTHSAIVTSKSSSNTGYVCIHDAQSYYSQCSLSGFYVPVLPNIKYLLHSFYEDYGVLRISTKAKQPKAPFLATKGRKSMNSCLTPLKY
ncbi:MAG: amidase domain-containing protein [Clostridia bacterium]